MYGMSAFSEYLAALIEERNAIQKEIAAKAGISKQLVTAIKKGERPPPPDCLTHFALALDLSPQERERFRQLAAVAHLPLEFQAEFVFILDRIERLERMQAQTETKLKRIKPSGN